MIVLIKMCSLSFCGIFVIILFNFAGSQVAISNSNSTTIIAKNVTLPGRILVKELQQPHHLFIGRCGNKALNVHSELVVLNNDGNSQVSANIRMNVDGPIFIDCVKIYDEDPEVSAFPSYVAGGIGHNYVEFNVITVFGKGFKIYVQIFGHIL